MNDPKKMNPELYEQIQRILNPTGPYVPGPPSLIPTPGSEHEQHKKPEYEKKAAIGKLLGKLAPMGGALGDHFKKHDHAYDLAGLGVLAAPAAYELGHEANKDPGTRNVGGIGKAVAEIGGLGLLAAPVAAHAFGKHAESFFDELNKLGAVSDQEAARALATLQDLEQNKPTTQQTLGYAGIGALANPLMHAAGNIIKKRSPFEGVSLGDKLRDVGAQAVKGGVGGTAVSIAQQQLDRHQNMGKLKSYVAERDKVAEDSPNPKVPSAETGPSQDQKDPANKNKYEPVKKMGSARKEEKKEEGSPNLKKFLAGTAGGMAAGLGGVGSGALASHMSGQADPELFDKVRKNAPKGLKVLEEGGPLSAAMAGGAHFSAGKEGPLAKYLPEHTNHDEYVSAGGSKNPSILAHELGHADINRSRLGRLAQNPLGISAGAMAGNVGALTGGATAFSDDERVQRAGVLAPLALSAPQLAFEAAASVQGLRRMRGAGANAKQLLHGAKTLAPAFGTYAGRAAAGSMGALQAQGMVGGARNYFGGEDKEAAAPPPLPGSMAGALFGGMKKAPGVSVSPGYAKAPAVRGLAGSGTPAMPMPKMASLGAS